MTTPIPSIQMPYGVTITSNGSAHMQVPEHPKRTAQTRLGLTPGPCRVQASYSGPESVEFRLYGTQGAVGAYGIKEILDVIPAKAGGSRSSRVISVGAVAGDWVQVQHPTGGTLSTGYAGTIEVIPLPQ